MERNPIPARPLTFNDAAFTAADPGKCWACGLITVLTRQYAEKVTDECQACGESHERIAGFSTGPRSAFTANLMRSQMGLPPIVPQPGGWKPGTQSTGPR